jgi:hypothetical protein
MNTTTKKTAAPSIWAGWHRPGPRQRWRQVCEGETWAKCWAQLGTSVQGGDLLVTSGSENPNHEPAERGLFTEE